MNRSEPEISKPEDLKSITLNNRVEVIDSIIITDPLNISVESVDERNALFRNGVSLDSTQFSIRMQLTDNAYAITIRKNMDFSDPKSFLIMTRVM